MKPAPGRKSNKPRRSTATDAKAALEGGRQLKRKRIAEFFAVAPPRHWWFALCLVVATLFAYIPALHGGFVWDDDSWTTGIIGLLRDASGLRSIWFQPTALQQYYPLTGTSFWLDYHLWKFWTAPYHVENVLLHASAALLFWQLLLRLRVPGAWLAGAIFALHPVMVLSAAWITERKNVLSLVFYLGALLAYGRYARWWMTGTAEVTPVPDSSWAKHRRFAFYGLALVLFLCALLAKTTVFALPAVILLIGWWKRGQIRWRADVLPSLPFFALSLGLCAVTSWLEKNHVGAQGPDFALSFPQRCLIAGHVFWFYLGKLFWPANLCFVYPRWQPDPGSWWQWLYPMTAIAVLLAPWLASKQIGRGPATALFFYVGTLFPLLGFMNAFGMRYSFVWNHWVYLPSLGIIALAAAGVVRSAELLRSPAVINAVAAIVLPALALLTWQTAGMFRNAEILWQTTLARNPNAWLAHTFIGLRLKSQGRMQEAIQHYRIAVQIDPNSYETQTDLGAALRAVGRFDEAIQHYQTALQINPNAFVALTDLGNVLHDEGRFDEAITNFQRAIEINPNYYLALDGLAWMRATCPEAGLRNGQEAVELSERACRLTDYKQPQFLVTLSAAYAEAGRFDDAVATSQKAHDAALALGQQAAAFRYLQLTQLFESGQPYREPAPK